MRSIICVMLLVVACGVEQPNSPTPALHVRQLQPGDVLEVVWSPSGVTSGSVGPSRTVECTTTISHPCSFITYTHLAVVSGDGASLEWTAASGGTDLAGVMAEERAPWIDALQVGDSGELVLDERGDDGGLRHEAHVMAEPIEVDGRGGYAGDVTWSLFNEAGYTTFHVRLSYD